MTRALILARQSKGDKVSIGQQDKECRRDVANLGWTLVDVLHEEESASRFAKRPRRDWPQLVSAVKAGRIDAIVLHILSRGNRRADEWMALLRRCEERGIVVRITDEDMTYDPRRSRHWKTLAEAAVDAEYESRQISDRIRRDVRDAVETGRPNGPAAFGFRGGYDPETGSAVRFEHEREAPIVRELFRRVADGEPLTALARELTERAVPPPGKWRVRHAADCQRSRSDQNVLEHDDDGRARCRLCGGVADWKWTAYAVRILVRRAAYRGVRSHNGNGETKATWPAIVDDAVWWRANRVLDERAAAHRRDTRTEHVLSGIPRCECGNVFSGVQQHRTGRRWYACRGCQSKINAEGLEELVLAYALGRLARPDVVGELRRADDEADAEAARAEADVEVARSELERWRQAAAAGRITLDSFAAVEPGLVQRIDEAAARAKRVATPPAVRDLVQAGDQLVDRWQAMSVSARRDAIAAVVNVSIRRAPHGGRRVPVAERVEITWRG